MAVICYQIKGLPKRWGALISNSMGFTLSQTQT